MLHLLIASVAFLATLGQGNLLIAEKRQSLAESHPLAKRACPAGRATCSVQGRISICARTGYKCCDADHDAPPSATCCPGGMYAPSGYYCCSDGSACPDGGSCTGCTAVNGNSGFPGISVGMSAAPSRTTTRLPVVPTTTRIVVANTYFTFTITYFYYQWFYIAQSTTSTVVTTTTTVSVFAANSAEAASSFSQISATVPLPTPSSATIPSPLPSQTSAIVAQTSAVASPSDSGAPTSSSTLAIPTNTPLVAAPSPSPSQFVGAANGLWARGNSYASLFAWLAVLAVGGVGFVANLVL